MVYSIDELYNELQEDYDSEDEIYEAMKLYYLHDISDKLEKLLDQKT